MASIILADSLGVERLTSILLHSLFPRSPASLSLGTELTMRLHCLFNTVSLMLQHKPTSTPVQVNYNDTV